MLGNGWHIGVAKAMLTLALLAIPHPAASSSVGDLAGDMNSIPARLHPDGPAWIPRVCAWYTASGLRPGPHDKPTQQHLISPTDCPDTHTHMLLSGTCIHPTAWVPAIDPSMHLALSLSYVGWGLTYPDHPFCRGSKFGAKKT